MQDMIILGVIGLIALGITGIALFYAYRKLVPSDTQLMLKAQAQQALQASLKTMEVTPEKVQVITKAALPVG